MEQFVARHQPAVLAIDTTGGSSILRVAPPPERRIGDKGFTADGRA